MSAQLDKIKAAIKAFEAVQTKYREFGARDTEPDGVFQRLIVSTLKGSTPVVLRGSEASNNVWQLYQSRPGWRVAEKALSAEASKVLKLIRELLVSELAEATEYLRQYCWRCF